MSIVSYLILVESSAHAKLMLKKYLECPSVKHRVAQAAGFEVSRACSCGLNSIRATISLRAKKLNKLQLPLKNLYFFRFSICYHAVKMSTVFSPLCPAVTFVDDT